jgi:hypothetical protein
MSDLDLEIAKLGFGLGKPKIGRTAALKSLEQPGLELYADHSTAARSEVKASRGPDYHVIE